MSKFNQNFVSSKKLKLVLKFEISSSKSFLVEKSLKTFVQNLKLFFKVQKTVQNLPIGVSVSVSVSDWSLTSGEYCRIAW